MTVKKLYNVVVAHHQSHRDTKGKNRGCDARKPGQILVERRKVSHYSDYYAMMFYLGQLPGHFGWEERSKRQKKQK
jgi:hypothetical protein